jgi:quercetin dioxygenase-like cupin family protein
MKKSEPKKARNKSAVRNAKPANRVALKGTISKAKRKAELRHVPWSSVEVEALNPLLGRQLVVGQNLMLARVLLKKGCIVPEHSHPNEQLTFIAEGALKFWIDGQEIVVNAGECLTIPPNMPHKAEALEDTVDFDVFNPPRADWISGTDAYLR